MTGGSRGGLVRGLSDAFSQYLTVSDQMQQRRAEQERQRKLDEEAAKRAQVAEYLQRENLKLSQQANDRQNAGFEAEQFGRGFTKLAPDRAQGLADLAPMANAPTAPGGMAQAGSGLGAMADFLGKVGNQAKTATGGWAKTNYSTGERKEANDLYDAEQQRKAAATRDEENRKAAIALEDRRSANDMRETQARIRETAAQRPEPRPLTGQDFTHARQMRGEFEKKIAPHVEVARALADISASANAPPSAQGDIALTFKFMKSLDPTSTVREGEYATAKNAGSVSDKMKNLYNQAVSGRFLTPQQRQQMLAIARDRAQSLKPMADRERARYGELAAKYGMDPNDVVYDPYEGLFGESPVDARQTTPVLTPRGGAPTRPPLTSYRVPR
jgi:hypothetical protein